MRPTSLEMSGIDSAKGDRETPEDSHENAAKRARTTQSQSVDEIIENIMALKSSELDAVLDNLYTLKPQRYWQRIVTRRNEEFRLLAEHQRQQQWDEVHPLMQSNLDVVQRLCPTLWQDIRGAHDSAWHIRESKRLRRAADAAKILGQVEIDPAIVNDMERFRRFASVKHAQACTVLQQIAYNRSGHKQTTPECHKDSQ
jgi:hypothetical protein